jgi:spore coat polysaccharide biosynthesis protein SpsF (cytidylyltransferase family)
MNLGAIIVCRFDSKRLPGKVLKKINGKPLLWYVISKCSKIARLSENIIVATSDREIDDPIVKFCLEEKIKVFRGSIDNVANRVLTCAIDNNFDYFFRINADSPFIEPPLLNFACDIAITEGCQVVTNLYPRSFPYGVSVELFSLDTFEMGYKLMSSRDDLEHVTLYFYQNMHLFNYYNIFNNEKNLSEIRLTIDSLDDFQKFKSTLGIINNKWANITYKDVTHFYQKEKSQT